MPACQSGQAWTSQHLGGSNFSSCVIGAIALTSRWPGLTCAGFSGGRFGLSWHCQAGLPAARGRDNPTGDMCPFSRATSPVTSAGVTAGDREGERAEKALLLLDIPPRARQQRVLLRSLRPHRPLLPWELQIHSPGQLRAAVREKNPCQATGRVQLFC